MIRDKQGRLVENIEDKDAGEKESGVVTRSRTDEIVKMFKE